MNADEILKKVCRSIDILIEAGSKYEGLFPSLLDLETHEVKKIPGCRQDKKAEDIAEAKRLVKKHYPKGVEIKMINRTVLMTQKSMCLMCWPDILRLPSKMRAFLKICNQAKIVLNKWPKVLKRFFG